MELPIDVVPGSIPPRFKWKQTVDTVNGKRTVDSEGGLPPSVEQAVLDLIALAKGSIEVAKQLQREKEELQRLNGGLMERIEQHQQEVQERINQGASKTQHQNKGRR